MNTNVEQCICIAKKPVVVIALESNFPGKIAKTFRKLTRRKFPASLHHHHPDWFSCVGIGRARQNIGGDTTSITAANNQNIAGGDTRFGGRAIGITATGN